ncbi:MAG TPA: MetQ/NlpA family ABC transporter substrate-binding protein [Enterococcus sp.]|nr:MetQ/NlpA family ABC transporter substrate-binding protein [Enterococcus sp.]HPR81042.1 MetQ/NlpA family ABC transporter substrate-binding protein [Enterococcus sp.]
MKKLLVSFGLMTLFLVGCGNAGENKTDTFEAEDTTPTVTVGVMPSTDNMPFIVAHEQGFDKKHGVTIELETFKSGKDRDAAFQAGTVDGINADLVGVAAYLQGGMDVKITSSTFGQFDLIATAETKSVEELKGKEVIVLKNQGPEYAVDQILAQSGMTGSDVKIVDVPQVPSRVELLQNDQAAAAILPEPFVTMTTTQGMTNLGSTRSIGINPFVLCFTTEAINEKSDALQGMYDAYNEAVDWMKEHDKSEYIQLFIDEIGFPEELKDDIQVPEYPHASQATAEDITKAFEWAKEKGILKEMIDSKDVLSDVYFK